MADIYHPNIKAVRKRPAPRIALASEIAAVGDARATISPASTPASACCFRAPPTFWQRVCAIYQVIFRPTGQIVYVGQTTKPPFLRWADQIEAAHRTAPADRTPLQAAICENGADASSWAMIETWPTQRAADAARWHGSKLRLI